MPNYKLPAVGDFIIHEGALFDRWVARQIVGETSQFWSVLTPKLADADVRRLKKSSLGRVAVYDTAEDAIAAAALLTERLAVLQKEFDGKRRALLDEVMSGGQG